jgi:hypothetical protein
MQKSGRGSGSFEFFFVSFLVLVIWFMADIGKKNQFSKFVAKSSF